MIDGDDAIADPRIPAIPDSHGHAKGEHKPFGEERPIPYTARMLFLWFYHACRRGAPRFMMVADHMNYLTFEDPAAVNLVRRALKLAQAGDLYGAAETAGVEVGHAQVVSEGLRRGMRYSIGAEVDNDPRSRPDAQNIVDAMRPDGMVRSVHFLTITHPTHGENWMWAFDNPEFKDLYEVVGTQAVWELYMATLLEAVEKLPGHIVGHFYVPAVFGHWPDDETLESYEDRLVDACAERGMAIELNSRYLYKHYREDPEQLAKFRTAHLRLMRKAVGRGVAIAVGSDAHSPKDQARAFEAVLALLDEAEINEIAFPIGGRLARVALRATEEILKQFAPPEPEPLPAPPEPEPVAAAPVPAVAVEKPKRVRPSRAKAAVAALASVAAVAVAAVTAVVEERFHDHTAKPDAESADAAVATTATPSKPPRPAKPRPTKRAPAEIAVAVPEATAEPAVEPAPVPKSPPPNRTVAAKAPEPRAKKSTTAGSPAKKPVRTQAKRAPAKPTAKKAAASKSRKKTAAPVKASAKKSIAKKPVAKKAVAKKTAAKKVVAKKAPAKKKSATARPARAKKAASKKASSAKRTVAKRPAPKKSAGKKAAGRSRR